MEINIDGQGSAHLCPVTVYNYWDTGALQLLMLPAPYMELSIVLV